MKKSIVILIIVAFGVVSCKQKAKKVENNYVIDAKTSTLKWTAYKTTDKVPVIGKFNEIIIENAQKGASVKEVVNGAKFKIPASSIFTDNEERDNKLKQFLFGVMNATVHITGTVELVEKNQGFVQITMNGITEKMPITYKITDQLVNISGVMNLDDWKAQSALESLNKACLDLHKGGDGISKTWNDVKLEAAIYVKFLKNDTKK